MKVSVHSKERKRLLLTVAEAIELMLSFGIFIISLLTYILELSKKKTTKKRRQ